MVVAVDRAIHTRSGLRLGATVWDGGGTGIILAHGGGQTRHAWKRTGALLGAQGYQVLAYDLRGHGESDWAKNGDYSLSRLRDDLSDVAATFTSEPVVVGASLGGISAMLSAGESGTAYRAVVLVDVTPLIEQVGSDQIVGFMVERMANGFASAQEAADAISAYLPNRPKPASTEGLKKYLRSSEDGRLRWHWDPQVMTDPNTVATASLEHARLVAAAGAMKMPVMLVRGGHSAVVSHAAVAEFLEAVPHARYRNLEDAHHMVVGDENDAFTTSIMEFIEEEGVD